MTKICQILQAIRSVKLNQALKKEDDFEAKHIKTEERKSWKKPGQE